MEIGLSVLDALVTPHPGLFVLAVAFDLCVGDPAYPAHPVRLIGRALSAFERGLRAARADGYGGGVLLFVLLTTTTLGVAALLVAASQGAPGWLWAILHVFLLYSMLAAGDLIHHVWRIEAALRRDALHEARAAAGALVGRDTDRMDAAACRRAGVESLSENLTDGFVSPVIWYAAGGLAGILVFKVVSTMDSMVGYKTPRYLRFGWCGARLDDVMNYVPARLAWLAISFVAAILPRLSGGKAWRVGLEQHAVLLGPNAGWSEAATAGALERRLVGPIWLNGVLVTERWIGAPADPPLSTADDMKRALLLVATSALVVAAAVALMLTGLQDSPEPPF